MGRKVAWNLGKGVDLMPFLKASALPAKWPYCSGIYVETIFITWDTLYMLILSTVHHLIESHLSCNV